MSGKVPVSRQTQIRMAADRFEDFTGHEPEDIDRVNIPPLPKAVALMGELEAVIYSTVRDGKREKYIHKFRAADRPALCVSPDGKQIVLVGGNYTWTERGIVDASDKS